MLAEVVAERAGLPADDFSARVLAGAVIGAALAAILADDADRIDEYFAQLAKGFKG